jgi:integrase
VGVFMAYRRGNGDGSIFKLSGRRRRPYAVRVTVGWTNDGKQKYKYIGYYEKKTEAKRALNKYLTDPTDVIVKNVTLKYVFDNMIEKSKYSDGTIRQYKSAFNSLEPLQHKKFNTITLEELENIMKNKKPSTQSAIKKALGSCYKYAMKHQYIKQNLADHLETDAVKNKRRKTPFTSEEIKNLWSNLGTQPNDDIPLMLLYTGCRISELLDIENINVNLQEKYFDIKKSKTEAGRRRVPIHEKILPLICARYDENNKYLIMQGGKKLSYPNYFSTYWNLHPHTIHETRHTFITQMNKTGVNDLTLKRIVGHANKDITEHYTHRNVAELLDAINKLDYN